MLHTLATQHFLAVSYSVKSYAHSKALADVLHFFVQVGFFRVVKNVSRPEALDEIHILVAAGSDDSAQACSLRELHLKNR